MNRSSCGWVLSGALVLSLAGAQAAVADEPVATTARPAHALKLAEILANYAKARGGADAWQTVHTMAWTGHVEAGATGAAATPFLMLFRRPNATHFEVVAQDQKSLRIFDGSEGWKQRATNQGPPEVQAYSAEEISSARDAGGVEGPLIDPAGKGVSVSLAGTGSVEGHAAYRLLVRLPSGQTRTDWIDTQSFLDLKYDRTAALPTGRSAQVSVFYRDYQSIKGLTLPMVIETDAAAGGQTERMVIEKIAINPTLPNDAFGAPATVRPRRNGVLVNTARDAAESR